MTRFVEVAVPDSDCEVLDRVREMLKQVRESGGTPKKCFAGVTSDLSRTLAREQCYATCQLDNPRQAQAVLGMLEELGFLVPMATEAFGTVVYVTRR